ncbi:MAG: aminodeoxychorismate lyase [Gammaproteobacteria bacterium]
MWVDGQARGHLPVSDRGLNYADGLFETMRIADGLIPLLELHLERLDAGCERLSMRSPERSQLRRELVQASADIEAGVVKLVLTRGSGGRGYAPPEQASCRRIISLHPLPEYPRSHYQRGVSVRLCETLLGSSPVTGGLKHLGRLEQVLASMEPSRGCAEGLMCNQAGEIIEGIRSNLFLVREHALLTPDVTHSGVAGVMRRLILDLAPSLGLEASVVSVPAAELARCDEVFLSSSVFGVWPVHKILGVARSDGAGAVTTRIMRAIAARGVAQWAP